MPPQYVRSIWQCSFSMNKAIASCAAAVYAALHAVQYAGDNR